MYQAVKQCKRSPGIQELWTQAVTLPPEDYPEVRKFFATMYGMEQQPIVLVKN